VTVDKNMLKKLKFVVVPWNGFWNIR